MLQKQGPMARRRYAGFAMPRSESRCAVQGRISLGLHVPFLRNELLPFIRSNVIYCTFLAFELLVLYLILPRWQLITYVLIYVVGKLLNPG